MRTQLPWHNLVHNRMRTAVAAAGVAFAVVLVFMQLGFLGSVETTVTQIYNALDFELLIRSRGYLHLSYPRTFPKARLYQAASVPGVRNVAPLYVELNTWRSPVATYEEKGILARLKGLFTEQEQESPVAQHKKRGILTMGIEPENCAFSLPEIKGQTHLLTSQESVLIDRKSRKEFGPRNGRRFSNADIGQVAEVADRQVRIVGHFELGTGLAADGAILLNVEGFCRLLPGRTPDEVSLGLVKLEKGADPETVARRLNETLKRALSTSTAEEGPPDVEVLTRAQVIQREKDRWIKETAIGAIFFAGVVVALLVGTAIVYQVLSSDVASHLPEYATLKAMGYGNWYLCGVVVQEAVILALFGFVPGLIFSEGLYVLTSRLSNIPIRMEWNRVLLVLVLTLGMCAVSGLAASRKVRSAEPAELF